jgi:hypothetical protein
MNMNSVWATKKAAPVFRSGFGIIPANLFYCTTARKIVSILRTDPFTPLRVVAGERLERNAVARFCFDRRGEGKFAGL